MSDDPLTPPSQKPAPDRTTRRTAAVIPAPGRGVRLGPGAPKALRALGGTPMLIHAVRAMADSRAVSLVVLVAPPDGAAEGKTLLDAHALPERTDFLVVPGGDRRQESVRLGLEALPPESDIDLVHAAAPPLGPVDTGDPEPVVATPDRSVLRAVQTPQGFDRAVLMRAHATVTEHVTDDASMIEQLGLTVVTVPGHEEAFKVTRPLDLVLAEAVLARR